jgi:hypothetical protein
MSESKNLTMSAANFPPLTRGARQSGNKTTEHAVAVESDFMWGDVDAEIPSSVPTVTTPAVIPQPAAPTHSGRRQNQSNSNPSKSRREQQHNSTRVATSSSVEVGGLGHQSTPVRGQGRGYDPHTPVARVSAEKSGKSGQSRTHDDGRVTRPTIIEGTKAPHDFNKWFRQVYGRYTETISDAEKKAVYIQAILWFKQPWGSFTCLDYSKTVAESERYNSDNPGKHLNGLIQSDSNTISCPRQPLLYGTTGLEIFEAAGVDPTEPDERHQKPWTFLQRKQGFLNPINIADSPAIVQDTPEKGTHEQEAVTEAKDVADDVVVAAEDVVIVTSTEVAEEVVVAAEVVAPVPDIIVSVVAPDTQSDMAELKRQLAEAMAENTQLKLDLEKADEKAMHRASGRLAGILAGINAKTAKLEKAKVDAEEAKVKADDAKVRAEQALSEVEARATAAEAKAKAAEEATLQAMVRIESLDGQLTSEMVRTNLAEDKLQTVLQQGRPIYDRRVYSPFNVPVHYPGFVPVYPAMIPPCQRCDEGKLCDGRCGRNFASPTQGYPLHPIIQ